MKRLLIGSCICAISFVGCARTEQPIQPQDQKDSPLDRDVIAAVALHTESKRDLINRNSRLKQDLKMDELDVVELVMELESKFKIDITETEAAKWSTVGDVVDCVNRTKTK
jgi:acyl carrier protein